MVLVEDFLVHFTMLAPLFECETEETQLEDGTHRSCKTKMRPSHSSHLLDVCACASLNDALSFHPGGWTLHWRPK